jgi:hypothetical protein
VSQFLRARVRATRGRRPAPSLPRLTASSLESEGVACSSCASVPKGGGSDDQDETRRRGRIRAARTCRVCGTGCGRRRGRWAWQQPWLCGPSATAAAQRRLPPLGPPRPEPRHSCGACAGLRSSSGQNLFASAGGRVQRADSGLPCRACGQGQEGRSDPYVRVCPVHLLPDGATAGLGRPL